MARRMEAATKPERSFGTDRRCGAELRDLRLRTTARDATGLLLSLGRVQDYASKWPLTAVSKSICGYRN